MTDFDRSATITRESFASFLERYADNKTDSLEWNHFVVQHYGDSFLEIIRRNVVRLANNQLTIHGNTESARDIIRAWAFLLRSSTNPAMNTSQPLPSWVIEQSLDWQHFDCCGDEDLFPFRCHACGHIYVLCYECDTLFTDLTNLVARRVPMGNDYACVNCSAQFDDDFMRSPRHRIPYADWDKASLGHLLVECDMPQLVKTLTATSDQIADFLRRGMRSSARRRMIEYRNFAESIMAHVDGAEASRESGYDAADRTALAQTMAWYDQLPELPSRSFALLGITDRLFP